MGEVADMMTDGTLCASCGVFIDDEAEGTEGPNGIPRYCRRCRRNGHDRIGQSHQEGSRRARRSKR